MKLVEILARELNEWPVDESLPLRQANDDSLYVSAQHTNGKDTNYLDIFVSKSENQLCDVTRAQWEAERARIAAEDADLQRMQWHWPPSQYEQELWDKVAVAYVNGAASDPNAAWTKSAMKEHVSQAYDIADAFMAERAKRLKR